MRRWTAPLALGAALSPCSMPAAWYAPPARPGWLIGLTPVSVSRKRT
jgi:hypothetical protein